MGVELFLVVLLAVLAGHGIWALILIKLFSVKDIAVKTKPAKKTTEDLDQVAKRQREEEESIANYSADSYPRK